MSAMVPHGGHFCATPENWQLTTDFVVQFA
jgi:hypothetical protein